MLELHFRAQQSVSEASGVHIQCCNPVAFQHEHKIRGTEESTVTSVCQKLQIAFLYLPTPRYLSTLMMVAYCQIKICTFLYNQLSSFGKKTYCLAGKAVAFKTLYVFNVLGIGSKLYKPTMYNSSIAIYKQIFNNFNLIKLWINLFTPQELFLLNRMKLRIWSCRAVNRVFNFCTLSCNKELLSVCKCPIKSYLGKK